MPVRLMESMPKIKSTQRISDNWLITLLRWLWWPVVLACLAISTVGLISILQAEDSGGDVLSVMGMGDLTENLIPALAEQGWSVQTFVNAALIPEIIAALGFLVVGFLIYLRRRDTWFGLFASLWMITFGLVDSSMFSEVGSGPLIAAYFVLVPFAYIGAIVFLLTYPDGIFQPRWSRYIAVLWLIFVLSTILSEWFVWTQEASALMVVPVLATVLYSQIYRYRKVSTPTQREQTKWLLVAIALLAITLALSGLSSSAATAAESSSEFIFLLLLSNTLVSLGNLGLVVAVGIAILRYRLWDIEVVVNRALIYGPLSLILAAIFAVSAVLINESTQQLFGAEDASTSAVISALVVATVFTPLRTRIEKWINTRLYADNTNLKREFVELSPGLREHLSQKELAAVVTDRIIGLLRTKEAELYLAGQGSKFAQIAASGKSLKGLSRFAVSDKAGKDLIAGKAASDGTQLLIPLYIPRLRTKELVGVLRIGLRSNGHGYSSDDKRALVELGAEVGTALYAAKLSARK
jgi:hypothetical protein